MFRHYFGMKKPAQFMRFVGKDLVARIKRHSDGKFGALDCVLWFYAHYRAGISFHCLSKMALVSRAFIVSSVNRVEKHIVRVLTGKKLVDLPPPAQLLAAMTEKQRLMYPGFIMLAADATDAPVYVPGSQAERRRFYSSKYQGLRLRWTALFVSRATRGCDNDKTAWNECGVVRALERMYGTQSVIDGQVYRFTVMGDKAYPCAIAPKDCHFHCTMTASMILSSHAMYSADKNLTTLRVIVELAAPTHNFMLGERQAAALEKSTASAAM
jgi:hypothetical protein